MAADLTPRVIDSSDSEYWERDSGKLRRVTIVTYRLGEFGPFRVELDREAFTESALREHMQRKADTLRSFT